MAIVPDVVGLSKGDAISVLKLVGFTNISVNSVRYAAKVANHGTIQQQSLAAGSTASLSDPILITAYEVLSRQVVKRVEIPLEDQPYMTDDGKYYLRYRVVSESGVSTSEWSPVAVLTGNKLSEILADNGVSTVDLSISSDDASIFVNWEIPAILKNTTFDGYARWSEDDVSWTPWQFVNTTTASNFSVKIPEVYKTTDILNPKYVQIWVQLPTKTKVVSEYAKLVASDSVTTKPIVVDGGSTIVI